MGGGTLSFVDLRPGSVRIPDEIRTQASTFGGESQVWNGFDLTVDARIENVLLQGGLSTGRVSHDYCDLQNALPETLNALTSGAVAAFPNRAPFGDTGVLEYCNRTENWLTQVKFLGSYTFPYDIQVAATLQNQPGPERAAEITFAAAQTSLGRPLTLFPSGVALNAIAPGSSYGDRFNQLDLRVTKIFDLAGTARFRAMFDLFNLFNANTVTLEQPGLAGIGDPTYLAPQAIMPGRLAKFAFQIEF